MNSAESVRHGRWGNLLTMMTFVIGLALVITGLYRHGLLTSKANPMGYGSHLTECHLKGPQGLHIKKGNWYFFVIGNLDEQSTILIYLEALRTAPQLRTGNMIPIALIDGYDEGANIQKYTSEHDLGYPVLPLHSVSSEALASLEINDHRKRYFLLDPDLKVAFYSEYMKPKDLRLLMGKHFSAGLGKQRLDSPIAKGSTVPFDSPIPVLDNQKEFSPYSRALIVFTSSCISCAIDNRLKEIALHQDVFKGVNDMEGLEVTLVFSPSFARRDVRYRLEEVDVSMPAYIAENFTGIEDPYLREPLHGSDVLIVKTDANAQVTEVTTLDNYLDAIFSKEL